MRVAVEEAIVGQLEEHGSLTFDELKERTTYQGQDVRKCLNRLLVFDGGLYVQRVEDGEKYYALR